MMISLKSKITQKVLNYFFLNPEDKRYINELAKILDLDPKNLFRKLEELENEGLLGSEFRGKERFFFLNKSYSLLEHYCHIFLKTLGLEQELREIINNTEGIKEAYIFGSYARSKMDASSDIDILLIGNHSTLQVQKKINKLQKEVAREFNVISLSIKEFEKKKKQKNQFIENILKSKPIKLL